MASWILKLTSAILPSRFPTWPKKSGQKSKYITNGKSFYGFKKTFFIIFKGLSFARNCLRPEIWALRHMWRTFSDFQNIFFVIPRCVSLNIWNVLIRHGLKRKLVTPKNRNPKTRTLKTRNPNSGPPKSRSRLPGHRKSDLKFPKFISLEFVLISYYLCFIIATMCTNMCMCGAKWKKNTSLLQFKNIF